MQQTYACDTQPFASLKRRDLLRGIATAGLVAGGGVGAGTLLAETATPGAPPTAFVAMSRFTTGSDITDEGAIARAWTQLVALDATFPAATDALNAAVRNAGLKTMAEYLASPLAQDAALRKTVQTIISAWYLGYTGTFVSASSKDDTGFVTFAGALMWRPTIDATVIPTYSRGATDFWIEPPQGTPAPKGAAGIADWQGSASSFTSQKA